ncbi:hypothetical protein [Mesorhizobium sp. ES1-3]|uniref:hypothetical protein n=1 Tax=Mesorhizobium sp. ES1-3 TaxID=2876628 RepID=UPI001CCF0799|nr:hypothetical protein [Mesorhizobium sp. ES1-3]MBZ9673428.1 hypothetical protein [Mesorhizobium sp. ES1-3]
MTTEPRTVTESNVAETVAVLRQTSDERGAEAAMDLARAMILGSVAFIMGEAGDFEAEQILRDVLAALPQN